MKRIVYYTTCHDGLDHHTTLTLDQFFAKIPPDKYVRAVSILESVLDMQLAWYRSISGGLAFPRSELDQMIDALNLQ